MARSTSKKSMRRRSTSALLPFVHTTLFKIVLVEWALGGVVVGLHCGNAESCTLLLALGWVQVG